MGNIKLTKEQLNQIKRNDYKLFPSGSLKTVIKGNKEVLIIDLKRLYGCSACTKVEFLDIISQYESIGYKFYFIISQYLYFYKKLNPVVEKLKKILKNN